MGFNFRDVGPLAGPGNSRFPAGRLFRSGRLGSNSVEEFGETIRSRGIRTIVDLRCPDERTEGPEYHRSLDVEVMNLPLLSVIEARWVRPEATDPASTAARYLDMVESNGPKVRALWEGLATVGGAPVLVHCAAGRDRTGIVCALVLGAWGAHRDDIAADYALSRGAVGDGYDASPDTIRCLFALVETKYGSVDELLDHLGVSSELRSLLWERYR